MSPLIFSFSDISFSRGPHEASHACPKKESKEAFFFSFLPLFVLVSAHSTLLGPTHTLPPFFFFYPLSRMNCLVKVVNPISFFPFFPPPKRRRLWATCSQTKAGRGPLFLAQRWLLLRPASRKRENLPKKGGFRSTPPCIAGHSGPLLLSRMF